MKALLLYLLLSALPASAEVPSYTQQIQEELRQDGKTLGQDQPADATPFLDAQKAEIEKRPKEPSAGYSDQIRSELTEKPSADGYSEAERLKLEPITEGAAGRASAIDAVNQNDSELHPKFAGDIHFAAGLKYSILANRIFSGGNGNFEAIYGGTYVPEIAVFGEWQPFHSEWFGNLGLTAGLGVGLFRGFGRYSVSGLVNPGGGTFPDVSQTKLSFHTVPMSVGITYRFNLLRILRPYATASGMAVGYVEARDDGLKAKVDYTLGAHLLGGVAILLDWFEKAGVWNSYASSGIRHSYITAEYGMFIPLMGAITYNASGFQAGLAFEF